MAKTVILQLRVEIPDKALEKGVRSSDIRNYVLGAVRIMWGSHEPPNEENNWTGSPLWKCGDWFKSCKFVREEKQHGKS